MGTGGIIAEYYLDIRELSMELILASGSPRRRELLSMCGYDFTVMPCSADEHI